MSFLLRWIERRRNEQMIVALRPLVMLRLEQAIADMRTHESRRAQRTTLASNKKGELWQTY